MLLASHMDSGTARLGLLRATDGALCCDRCHDLRHHDCIRNRLPNGAIFGWHFEKNGKTLHAAVEGRLIVNDIELSIRAVREGVGLAYLLHDYIAADLKAGRLVALLDDWSPRLSGFFLYHSSRRQVTALLQAFIAFLKAEAARRGSSSAAQCRGLPVASLGRKVASITDGWLKGATSGHRVFFAAADEVRSYPPTSDAAPQCGR